MSRIEAEAREVLLRRRRALSHGTAQAAADPAAYWSDYEAMPEPVSEGARRELEEIDDALARIQEGSYGRCLNCGGPLGLQRLRAIPEAKFCLACSGHARLVE